MELETIKCKGCNYDIDIIDFKKETKNKNGLRQYCTDCIKKRNHEYYIKNKGKWSDKYMKKNKE